MRNIAILIVFLSFDLLAASFPWKPPQYRENGDRLKLEEIGGYELVGFNVAGAEVWRHVIEDGKATCYVGYEPDKAGAVTFKIAAYDTDALYSEFVPIAQRLCAPNDFRLEAPKQFQFD